jgi:hypothetical protein
VQEAAKDRNVRENKFVEKSTENTAQALWINGTFAKVTPLRKGYGGR